MHVTKHTVPLCRGPAALLAVNLASEGHARLGFGIVLQQRLGLRPSEMLSILPEDVVLPEDQGFPLDAGYAQIGLGVRTGTKSNRPQTAIVRAAA